MASNITDIRITKPIRLYLLPYLAKKEIFEQMDTVALVELSFLSKRIKAHMRFCRLSATKIQLGSTVQIERNSVRMEFQKECPSDLEGGELRKIGGCDFRSWTKMGARQVGFDCNNEEDVLHIYHHLSDIFKPRFVIYDFYENTTGFIEKYMKNAPHSMDKLDCGDSDDKDQRKLDIILDHCEVREFLMYYGQLDHLHEKMTNIQHLWFRFVKNPPMQQFLSLQAKRIQIRHSTFTNQNFVDFIAAWKTSNWRCESFVFGRGYINMSEALQLVNAHSFDHKTNEKCDPEAENVSLTHMCVERDDGKLACINLTPMHSRVASFELFEFRLV